MILDLVFFIVGFAVGVSWVGIKQNTYIGEIVEGPISKGGRNTRPFSPRPSKPPEAMRPKRKRRNAKS